MLNHFPINLSSQQCSPRHLYFWRMMACLDCENLRVTPLFFPVSAGTFLFSSRRLNSFHFICSNSLKRQLFQLHYRHHMALNCKSREVRLGKFSSWFEWFPNSTFLIFIMKNTIFHPLALYQSFSRFSHDRTGATCGLDPRITISSRAFDRRILELEYKRTIFLLPPNISLYIWMCIFLPLASSCVLLTNSIFAKHEAASRIFIQKKRSPCIFAFFAE